MKNHQCFNIKYSLGFLILLLSFQMSFISDNAYARGNSGGLLPTVTKNECLLAGGKIVDGLKDGVLCCYGNECTWCSDCTLEDVIVFKGTVKPTKPKNQSLMKPKSVSKHQLKVPQ